MFRPAAGVHDRTEKLVHAPQPCLGNSSNPTSGALAVFPEAICLLFFSLRAAVACDSVAQAAGALAAIVCLVRAVGTQARRERVQQWHHIETFGPSCPSVSVFSDATRPLLMPFYMFLFPSGGARSSEGLYSFGRSRPFLLFLVSPRIVLKVRVTSCARSFSNLQDAQHEVFKASY